MQLYTYESYHHKHGWISTPDPGDQSLSYGDFKAAPYPEDVDIESLEDKENLYIMPEEMCGSDYANGLYAYSNYRSFLRDYGEVSGVYDVWGRHGTYAIVIRLSTYLSHEEMRIAIDHLGDYLIYNEEDHSELEVEKTQEAWDSWAKDDALRELQKSHPDFEEFEEPEDFQYIFDMAAEEVNEYWEAEGNDMYIRIERVIPVLRDRLLAVLTSLEDLPLLVGHDWESSDAQEVFEQRLKGTHKPEKTHWDFHYMEGFKKFLKQPTGV